jgi:hypothetical protein
MPGFYAAVDSSISRAKKPSEVVWWQCLKLADFVDLVGVD